MFADSDSKFKNESPKRDPVKGSPSNQKSPRYNFNYANNDYDFHDHGENPISCTFCSKETIVFQSVGIINFIANESQQTQQALTR